MKLFPSLANRNIRRDRSKKWNLANTKLSSKFGALTFDQRLSIQIESDVLTVVFSLEVDCFGQLI